MNERTALILLVAVVAAALVSSPLRSGTHTFKWEGIWVTCHGATARLIGLLQVLFPLGLAVGLSLEDKEIGIYFIFGSILSPFLRGLVLLIVHGREPEVKRQRALNAPNQWTQFGIILLIFVIVFGALLWKAQQLRIKPILEISCNSALDAQAQ